MHIFEAMTDNVFVQLLAFLRDRCVFSGRQGGGSRTVGEKDAMWLSPTWTNKRYCGQNDVTHRWQFQSSPVITRYNEWPARQMIGCDHGLITCNISLSLTTTAVRRDIGRYRCTCSHIERRSLCLETMMLMKNVLRAFI